MAKVDNLGTYLDRQAADLSANYQEGGNFGGAHKYDKLVIPVALFTDPTSVLYAFSLKLMGDFDGHGYRPILTTKGSTGMSYYEHTFLVSANGSPAVLDSLTTSDHRGARFGLKLYVKVWGVTTKQEDRALCSNIQGFFAGDV